MKDMYQDYHKNLGMSLGIFQRTHACVNRDTFMDHAIKTMCLGKIDAQCNMKSACCMQCRDSAM